MSYDKQYIKDNIHQKTISFNRKNEGDEELYEWITQQANQAQYLKNLIREDMEKHKK